MFECLALSMVTSLCPLQGEDGSLHPVQCQDLQDGVSRHLRLQTQLGDESNH